MDMDNRAEDWLWEQGVGWAEDSKGEKIGVTVIE